MLQFSQFVCALSYSVWDVFNQFLFKDATDRRKICSDQKRFFIAISLYPLSFFASTPFKVNKRNWRAMGKGTTQISIHLDSVHLRSNWNASNQIKLCLLLGGVYNSGDARLKSHSSYFVERYVYLMLRLEWNIRVLNLPNPALYNHSL